MFGPIRLLYLVVGVVVGHWIAGIEQARQCHVAGGVPAPDGLCLVVRR